MPGLLSIPLNTRHHRNRTIRRVTLAQLRSLAPNRHVAFNKSLRLARRQAVLLLTGNDVTAAVPLDVITDLRHIRTEFVTDQWLPSAAFWDTSTRCWVIQMPGSSPFKHQRVAVARELKHILDYHNAADLYQGTPTVSGRRQAELAADYFAGHLLVPSWLLRHTWKVGITSVAGLSDYFCVPKAVIRQRLSELQLGRYASRTFYHLTPPATDRDRGMA